MKKEKFILTKEELEFINNYRNASLETQLYVQHTMNYYLAKQKELKEVHDTIRENINKYSIEQMKDFITHEIKFIKDKEKIKRILLNIIED